MRAIIFSHMAEYADYASKTTYKLNGKMIRVELWNSYSKNVKVEDRKFLTKRKALREFERMIGKSTLSGNKVLNAFPKRETWETKRSK